MNLIFRVVRQLLNKLQKTGLAFSERSCLSRGYDSNYTRYCSGVECFPEHIPVVIFVSSRVYSLMFERSLVFPEEALNLLNHRAMSEFFPYLTRCCIR